VRTAVTATLLSGATQTGEGELAPLADRVAFERHFGITAAVLSRLSEAFDDDGQLKAEADAHEIKEEWVAFLIWRLLRRVATGGVADYDSWIDDLATIGLEQLEEEVAGTLPPTATVTALSSS